MGSRRSRRRDVELLQQRIAGFGAVTPLLEDPEVEEIWINEPGRVFAARRGEHELTGIVLDGREVEELVERMLARAPVAAWTGPIHSWTRDSRTAVASTWRFPRSPITGRSTSGSSSGCGPSRARSWSSSVRARTRGARFLDAAVRAGLSIVVAGAVGAGKTTLLNCLLSSVPARERIVTCEEVFELRVDRPDVVAMQCRQPNLEGEGAVGLRDLVRESLRMRPDRIVIGEVRGAESLDMLLALNSGAVGMTSVHANSAREALRKLVTLPLLAGSNLDRRFVAATVAAGVDLVVFCRRGARSPGDHRDPQRRRAGRRRGAADGGRGLLGCRS